MGDRPRVTPVPIDAIFRALRWYPQGVTAPELAKRLQMPQQTLSSRLAKQFMYGKIDRYRAARNGRTRAVPYHYFLPKAPDPTG